MSIKQITESIKGILKLANTSSNELKDFANYSDIKSAIGSDKYSYFEVLNELVDYSLIAKIGNNHTIAKEWETKTWKELIKLIANRINSINYTINIDYEEMGKQHIYFLRIKGIGISVHESYIV